MSNIGRRPIDIGSAVVELKGQEVHYKGKKASGVYILPDFLQANLQGKYLTISLHKNQGKNKNFWGMHAALLANKIKGADVGFEKTLQINGLGYKVQLVGNKMVVSLGYSHKIEIELPAGISVDIDKVGQRVTFKSYDKELVGQMCDRIRSLRPPEPYKGTGVKLADEIIIRKAGKAKASA